MSGGKGTPVHHIGMAHDCQSLLGGTLASRLMQLVVGPWQSEAVVDPLPAPGRLARESWPDLASCLCSVCAEASAAGGCPLAV